MNQYAAFICTSCQSAFNAPKKKVKGLFVIELLLWGLGVIMLFIVPVFGLLLLCGSLAYSLYRVFSKEKVCPACGAPNFIPASSPKARELQKDASSDTSQTAEALKTCPFCAETIKAEAIKCKHCGSELKPE